MALKLRRASTILWVLAVFGVVALRASTGEANALRFNADAEAYLMEVHAWAHQGRAPDRGVLNVPLGIDLGPLYLATLVPANWITASPLGVHAVNVLWFFAGLVVFILGFRERCGVLGASTIGLLYAVSEQHAVLMEVAYHVGAVPGASLAFLGCAAGWVDTRARRWFFGGAVSLALLLQLHPLAAVHGVTALVLLWTTRASLSRRLVGGGLAAFVAALAPLLWYALPTLGEAGAGARHSADSEIAWLDTAVGTYESLGARWGLSPASAALVLALCALGVSRVRRDALAPALLLGCVAGFVLVAAAMGFESSGRYYLALIPTAFAGAACGLCAAQQRLGDALGPALVGALVVLGAVLPPTEAITAPSGRDTLSAREQEAVMDHLASRGVGWTDLSRRVHGPLLGSESGPRYLALAARDRVTSSPTESVHWVIRLGDDPPPRPPLATTQLAPGGRPIQVHTLPEAVNGRAIRAAGAPCANALPFMWLPASSALLRTLGFPGHGPDVHRCLERGQGLTLPVQGPLVVELADEGTFRGQPTRAAFRWHPSGELADGTLTALTDRARYHLDPPPGATALTVTPAPRRVVYFDAY